MHLSLIRQSARRVFPIDPNPIKVNQFRVTVALGNQKTANAQLYTTVCLPQEFEERPQSNLILHHDNGSFLTERRTRQHVN